MKPQITIIGAGLGGCFLALLFAKRGHTVTVYERFSEKEMFADASKRSFTLTMYGYGVETLKEVGLWDVVSSLFVPIEGSLTQVGSKNASKPILSQNDPKMHFYAVSRADLLRGLLKEARTSNLISFHFAKKLVDIDYEKKTITLEDKDSEKTTTVSCDVVFGADGMNSKVREAMQIGEKTYIKDDSPWTYKQIMLDQQTVEKATRPGRFSQNWTRKNAIFIAYPNTDGTYCGMLVLPKNNTEGFAALTTAEKIKHFVTNTFPDFLPALPAITESILHNPEGHYSTIYADKWYYKDFVAILGDAAHAFLPFYGQGVSAAFADSMELMRLYDTYGPDWGKIFPLYQAERKPNTDALAELSKATLENYRRESRADYTAIYHRFESLLASSLPTFFSPPPFEQVAKDQPHAAKYIVKHKKQRQKLRLLGAPLLVGGVTGLIFLADLFIKHAKKR